MKMLLGTSEPEQCQCKCCVLWLSWLGCLRCSSVATCPLEAQSPISMSNRQQQLKLFGKSWITNSWFNHSHPDLTSALILLCFIFSLDFYRLRAGGDAFISVLRWWRYKADAHWVTGCTPCPATVFPGTRRGTQSIAQHSVFTGPRARLSVVFNFLPSFILVKSKQASSSGSLYRCQGLDWGIHAVLRLQSCLVYLFLTLFGNTAATRYVWFLFWNYHFGKPFILT